MSETVSEAVEEAVVSASGTGERATEQHHPGDLEYILIALGLAVLTGIEVGIYYLKSNDLTMVVLLVLMVLKFSIVVGFFMHLRFDSPVLRRLFLGGLILATTIYIIVFFIFGVFTV